MKRTKQYIALVLVLASLSAFAACFLFFNHDVDLGFIATAVFIILVLFLYKIFKDIYWEFLNFIEALRYRDFSQRFATAHTPRHLKIFRSGFNTITDEYKKLSFEKTMQFHYLQNVLEMADTGIMAFDISSGDVIWVNQLMKQYLQTPVLKNMKTLKALFPSAFREIENLHPKEQKIVLIKRLETTTKFLIASNTFTTHGKTFKLIALKDIDETLDITESEAWKKLLLILTHEIMNSITPISSVASTLQNRLETLKSSEIANTSYFQDFEEGISTIKSRSNGLLKFAESYRSLNRIDSINLSVFYMHDLFETLLTLMNPMMEQRNITFDIILKSPLMEIKADYALVEQMLINLLLNAMDAVKDKTGKEILLTGEFSETGAPVIKVSDNGTGMNKEILDKIFIPFFTTKKTGSGIGLSLCKQIMLLHKGSIQVKSTEGKGTIFSLLFKNI